MAEEQASTFEEPAEMPAEPAESSAPAAAVESEAEKPAEPEVAPAPAEPEAAFDFEDSADSTGQMFRKYADGRIEMRPSAASVR